MRERPPGTRGSWVESRLPEVFAWEGALLNPGWGGRPPRPAGASGNEATLNVTVRASNQGARLRTPGTGVGASLGPACKCSSPRTSPRTTGTEEPGCIYSSPRRVGGTGWVPSSGSLYAGSRSQNRRSRAAWGHMKTVEAVRTGRQTHCRSSSGSMTADPSALAKEGPGALTSRDPAERRPLVDPGSLGGTDALRRFGVRTRRTLRLWCTGASLWP